MGLRILMLTMSVVLLSSTSHQANKNKGSNAQDENKKNELTKDANKSLVENDMVYFKGGTFMMGSTKGTPQEQSVHQVQVRSFKISVEI